ncbi:MAG TPA: NPCBM/NEW2 domain-containing protein [Phycisphaerae bacterium]|nr:NPCBM/NEW2 domain-containing protein [Phycisphaerae bacterium]
MRVGWLRLVCVVGVVLAAGASPLGAAQTVWLDELDVRLAECGWERTRSKKSVGGNPIRLRGKTYERGIGTHPPGEFVIDLGGGSTRFTAVVGIDDEAAGGGSAEFLVYGDGKMLWQSGVVRGKDPVKTVDVDVTGMKLLRLVVTVAGDGYGNDHTDWAQARFEVVGQAPEAAAAPEPTRYETLAREMADLRGRSKALAPQTFRQESLVVEADRDPLDVVLRRTGALLARLGRMTGTRDLSAEAAALDALKTERDRTDAANTGAREALFDRAVAVRRRIAFANPLLDFDKILFLKKHFLPPSEGQGNHMCDQYFGFHAIREGGLFVLENPFSDQPKVRDVLADSVCERGRFKGAKLPPGGYLSPDLSYDGRTILFAWTEAEPTRYKWTEKSTYHLFKVNVDGSHLEQLTDGPWNDFGPCWMPNGRVCFISERRGGYGRCHGRPVPVYTLHSLKPDGSDIVCLSYHESNEWAPSIDAAGMIVYTRWDYVDRGFNQAHHPWVATPDGRDARAVHGNFSPQHNGRPQFEIDVRSIPGSSRYVATAACHHGQAYGSLVVLDPSAPDDERMGPVSRLTPEVQFPESDGGKQVYATAWPLSEEFYLCVYDPQGEARRGTRNNFGLYLLDAFGNKVLLYRDPAISCLSPMPLRPRPAPPLLAHGTAVGRPDGTRLPREALPKTARVGVVNVYDGLLPWPEATKIAALRIMQVIVKSTPPANGPRIGYGDQKSARAVLGTVPVEADGSAYFELPVGRAVYFQALDEKGLAVQSMRSDTYVHPGETLMCQGCHQPRARNSAHATLPLAMRRGPSRIRPDAEGSLPFSFARLVQPVLDKHCVTCHAKEAKAPDLAAGDWQKNRDRWFTSYNNLRKVAFFWDGAAWTSARTTPGKFGAHGSSLYAMLAKGHHKLDLPAEDLHRIALWLDSNSDFFGAYQNTEAQARGEVVWPAID